MPRFRPILMIASLLLLAAGAFAKDGSLVRRLHLTSGDGGLLVASGAAAAKSDTVTVYGGPGRHEGKFHDPLAPFLPDMQGWVGVGNGSVLAHRWQASLFQSPTGTLAAWCGGLFLPCDQNDPVEGYGNDWNEVLQWEGAVADPGQATEVTVGWSISWETEPDWDFVQLQVWRETAGAWTTLAHRTGTGTEIEVTYTATVAPADLVDGRVRVRVRAVSDQVYSDQDCQWPTAAGLCQVDDLRVSGTNGLPSVHDDFEDGLENAAFQPADPVNFSFAQAWPQLATLDPCNGNDTPQLAFVDDGVPVPCTGGTAGVSWVYGPGGYVVCPGDPCLPTNTLQDAVWSPPIAWADAQGQLLPEDYTAGLLEYDVYDHLPLNYGIVRTQGIRYQERDTGFWSGWRGDDFVMYANTPVTRRASVRIDPFLDAAPAAVQISFGLVYLGWFWGGGEESTPAPYFDNVAVRAIPSEGPLITTRELQLFQDAFPAHGLIDYADLGSNDVRVDRAEDINGSAYSAIQPGDSITVDVRPTAPDGELVGPPVLHYVMHANPLFDPHRAHPTSGTVAGEQVISPSGPIAGRYSFDLPDEDFFYPGDVIHYYIRAEESSSFGLRASTLPADLEGYGIFPDDAGWIAAWNESFEVRALPTLFSTAPGDGPVVLLWRDAGAGAGTAEWNSCLANLGLVPGTSVDIYRTRAADSGVSNGLGSRATPAQIAGYEVILYDAGSRDAFTLNVPDQTGDKSDDVGLLAAWLAGGGKLAVFGNKVATDLVQNGGAAGAAFLTEALGAGYVGADISVLVDNQTAPALVPDPLSDYLAAGFFARSRCGSAERFDALQPAGGNAIYRWLGISGDFIYFPWAAGLHRQLPAGETAFFPIGFASLWSGEADGHLGIGPVAVRTALLADILLHFGILPQGGTAVASALATVAVSAAPNPFNPSVQLSFTAPSAVRASVDVYDLRGAKVRALLDERVAAGAHAVRWDGRDGHGADVASGVYFARVRVGEVTRVEKLALVR